MRVHQGSPISGHTEVMGSRMYNQRSYDIRKAQAIRANGGVKRHKRRIPYVIMSDAFRNLLYHSHRIYEGSRPGDPLPFTSDDLEVMIAAAIKVGYCYHCGKALTRVNYSPDHMTALTIGGKTELSNIRIICWPCNRRKGHALDPVYHFNMATIRFKRLIKRISPV